MLVGDNIAVTNTEYGKVRGYVLRGIHYYPRHSLRRRHLRRQPLHASAKTQTLDRCLSGAVVGQFGAAEHGEPVRQQIRLLPRSLELRRRERGLSPHQRLHAGHQRRQEAAGDVLDSRRRIHRRQRRSNRTATTARISPAWAMWSSAPSTTGWVLWDTAIWLAPAERNSPRPAMSACWTSSPRSSGCATTSPISAAIRATSRSWGNQAAAPRSASSPPCLPPRDSSTRPWS